MTRYFIARGETLTLDETARGKLRGSFVRLSDGVTHYELKGPAGGDLVLLVPGLTIPLFYWDALAAELHARGLRTLAYSAYGRGYSDRVRAPYDKVLFLRQVGELTSALGLTGARHIVGTSMGALIAMSLALEDEARTTSLTLIGPAGLETRPPLPARLSGFDGLTVLLGRYLGQRGLLSHLAHNVRTPEQAAALQKMVAEAYRYEGSIYALFATLQAFPLIRQHDLFQRAGRSSVPILLLWGDEDRVTPIDRLDQVRGLLHPTECHVIPDCGHMAPFERPAKVAERMALFFSRLPEGKV